MDRLWSVVTVTYNSSTCLKTYWPQEPEARNYSWIVVDNSSSDDTVETASGLADNVILSGGNLGFSVANNIGLSAVQTPYVVFVNPDVSIGGQDWQALLAETLELTRGLVAPQLLSAPGLQQPNARGIPFLTSKVRNRIRPGGPLGQRYARTNLSAPTYCAWAMGAAIASRTEDIRHLGGWDESYFLYYEDHELGLRAWRQGRSVVVDPRIQWLHAWNRATAKFDRAAWRFELESMRTFYRAHPELLRRGWSADTRQGKLERRGYGRLYQNLWRPITGTERTSPAPA